MYIRYNILQYYVCYNTCVCNIGRGRADPAGLFRAPQLEPEPAQLLGGDDIMYWHNVT